MMGFLAAKSLFGAPRWLLGLTVLALLAGSTAWIVGKINSTVETISTTARDAGRTEAVVEGNKVTLEQVEKANEAVIEIRNDRGDARFCECVRGATKSTASNCVRFLANKSVLGDAGDPVRYCAERGR
jgi:hypothetical protein